VAAQLRDDDGHLRIAHEGLELFLDLARDFLGRAAAGFYIADKRHRDAAVRTNRDADIEAGVLPDRDTDFIVDADPVSRYRLALRIDFRRLLGTGWRDAGSQKQQATHDEPAERVMHIHLPKAKKM